MICLCVKTTAFGEKKTQPNNKFATVKCFRFLYSLHLFLLVFKVYPVDFVLAKNELSE